MTDRNASSARRILFLGAAAAWMVAGSGCFINGKIKFTQDNSSSNNMYCSPGGCMGTPPSAGYQGYFADPIVTNVAPLITLKHPAGGGAGAPEILGGAQMSGAELSFAAQPVNPGQPATTTDGAYVSVTGTAATPERAVIQLQWDASQFDLVNNTYASLQLQVHGGAEGTGCPSPMYGPAFGVYTGIFDQAKGYWLPLEQSTQWGTQLYWQWGGQAISLNLRDLVVTKSDGKSYLVVNIESNYASTSATCASAVHVASVGLQVMNGMSPPSSCQGCALGVNSTYPSVWNGTKQVTKVPYGGSAPIFVQGGTPPYSFSVVTGTGKVDPSTGHFTAPLTAEADTVQAMDSRGLVTTVEVDSVDPNTVLGVRILSSSGAGPFPAGTCYGLSVGTVGFDGSSPLAPLATSYNVSSTAGPFYSDVACTVTLGGAVAPPIAAATSSVSFYFKVFNAGTNLAMSINGSGLTGDATFYSLTAGAPSMVNLRGGPPPASPTAPTAPNAPQHLTVGTCVPYTVLLTDAYSNPSPNAQAPITVTTTLGNANSTLYSDPACTVASSPTIPAGSASGTFYYRNSTPGLAAPATDSLTFGSANYTPTLGGWGTYSLTVDPAGTPIGYRLALDPSSPPVAQGACVILDVQTVDGLGTLAAFGSAHSVFFNNWGMTGPAYTDTACATPMTGSLPLGGAVSSTAFSVRIPPMAGTWQMRATDMSGSAMANDSALFSLTF